MLVTKKAPNFIADAILPNGEIITNLNFKEYIYHQKTIIFFWPLDFTFICPTELITLNNKFNLFLEKNTKILGISVDSIYTHLKWRNTSYKNGGIGPILFPMISDLKKEIISLYDIQHISGVALRATFIIDKHRIIRHQSINDLDIGRNINEILRIIDALDHIQKHNKVCPAQWEKGKTSITPNTEGIKQYLTDNINDLK